MGLDDTILAFRRGDLASEWLEQDFSRLKEAEFHSSINGLEAIYKQRRALEEDECFKQPIPYLLLRNGKNELACFTRQGNEKRLHGLWSCGIGGHVDLADHAESNSATLQVALQREMQEELCDFEPRHQARFMGIINEEDTKVGRTHIGFVYLLELDQDEDPQAGDELGELHWKSQAQLRQAHTEHWTQLALDLLLGLA